MSNLLNKWRRPLSVKGAVATAKMPRYRQRSAVEIGAGAVTAIGGPRTGR